MKSKAFVILILLLLGFIIPTIFVDDVQNYLASLFFVDDLTSEEVKNHYRDGRVSVLIVPGHDGRDPGTTYNGIKEADRVALVGEYLYEHLKNNDQFDVTLVRNRNGYTKEFADYFLRQKDSIGFFIQSVWQRFHQLIRSDQVTVSPPAVQHNRASKKTQLILYGINKWANEKNIDIVLHLHLNDYPRSWRERKYNGFSMYISGSALPNHEVSYELAQHFRNVFSKYWAESNLPLEKEIIIESPYLIATGAAGSLRSASLLVEYGYIYESRFHTDLMLKEAAFRTYEGLLSFFDDKKTVQNRFSWIFPYQWNKNIPFGSKLNDDVIAAQSALFKLGFYPPTGKTKRECPINGNLRTCTRRALANFQQYFEIIGNGEFGPKTRGALNTLF